MAVKVLLVLTSAELGGAEQVVLDVVRGLNGSDYALHVVLPRDGRLTVVLNELKTPYTVLPFGSSFAGLSRTGGSAVGLRQAWVMVRELADYLYKLRLLAETQGVDLVYSHGLKAELLTAVLGFWSKLPIVWHLHTFSPARGILGLIYQLASRVPALLIANSAAVAKQVPAVASAKTQVVHCGVDTARFRPMSRHQAALRLGLSVESRQHFIGMVSVLAPWKGVDLFLRAVAPVLSVNPDWAVVVVGDVLYDTVGHASYQNELASLVKHLGIAERVRFLPFQADPVPAYNLLDIFVHASKTPEPFGRVIAEAMSSERAVIASAGGGALEQITSGTDGLLTTMDDEAALRAALVDLVQDAVGRHRLGKAARQKIETLFTIERFNLAIHSALDTVETLGRKPRRPAKAA